MNKNKTLNLFISILMLPLSLPVLASYPYIESYYIEDSVSDNRPFKKKRLDIQIPIQDGRFEKGYMAPLLPYPYEDQEDIQAEASISYNMGLPDEIMLIIFKYLSFRELENASQVCKAWERLSNEPQLWKGIRLKIKGDYPEINATRENAKLHFLRVTVNTFLNLTLIDKWVRNYHLNIRHPFSNYHKFIGTSLDTRDIIEDRAIQGEEAAIKKQLEGLLEGKYGYKRDLKAAVISCKNLVIQGNQAIIQSALSQLMRTVVKHHASQTSSMPSRYRMSNKPSSSEHEFIIDPFLSQAAVILNEGLIERGDEAAIQRRIEGLLEGKHGYECNSKATFTLNEELVERGDEAAIERKIKGLLEGKYGYERNHQDAVIFCKNLATQGNQTIIQSALSQLWRMIDWYHALSYSSSPFGFGAPSPSEDRIIIDPLLSQAEVALNEGLIEKGDEDAIERKIKGLLEGKHGYECNSKAAVILNEVLVERGDEAAIQRKIEGLLEGKHGYERNHQDAVIFCKNLATQGNQTIIQSALSQLKEWIYHHHAPSYSSSPFGFGAPSPSEDRIIIDPLLSQATVALNEGLIEKGDRTAIQRKIEGLLKGKHGYERNHQDAVIFCKNLVTQGNQTIIQSALSQLKEWIYHHHAPSYSSSSFGAGALSMFGPPSPSEDRIIIDPLLSQAEVALNEGLIEKGDEDAIERKIEGLLKGRHGYERDLKATVTLNNKGLVERGNEAAIQRSIKVLLKCKYGYEYEQEKDIHFNRIVNLILSCSNNRNGDTTGRAIYSDERPDGEIEGEIDQCLRALDNPLGCPAPERLCIRTYNNCGRTEQRSPLIPILNDRLVKRDNIRAIQRKIEGLLEGKYGYERDPRVVRIINDLLQSEEAALQRRVEGLLEGRHGYERDLRAAVTVNEELVERGDETAIQRKIEGLLEGKYGYKKDSVYLKNWLEVQDAYCGEFGHRLRRKWAVKLGCLIRPTLN